MTRKVRIQFNFQAPEGMTHAEIRKEIKERFQYLGRVTSPQVDNIEVPVRRKPKKVLRFPKKR